MKKFNLGIAETRHYEIAVKANSLEEAIELASKKSRPFLASQVAEDERAILWAIDAQSGEQLI